MMVVRTTTLVTLFLALAIPASSSATIATIQQSEFTSTVLDEVVTLQIALPLGYEEATRSYPVLYVLDGNFFMNQAVSAVDFLSTPRYMHAMIPSYIVVGITTEDRDHDFTPTHDEEYDGMAFPTSGGAEKFRRFLMEELVPFVDSNHRTADRKVLSGWSLGGLFTTWTYLKYPESFDSYLAISPSLWWDDMVVCEWVKDQAANPGLSPRRLTVTLGGLERAPMDESVKDYFLPLMKSHGISSNLEYVEIAGEGHNSSPLIAFQKGLVSLHRMTMIPDEIVQGDLTILAQHLIEMAGNYGLHTDDPDEAGQFLIKRTLNLGSYEIGMQIARILADRVTVTPRSMVAVGEMAFRLNRYDTSVEAFKTAIAREEALDEPDPDELKYFQEYLEWIEARID